jgi:hypothetical protein
MISVSPALDALFDAYSRNLQCKIEVNYTDVELDPTITASSSDNNYKSFPRQMVNGKVDTTYKYIECDNPLTVTDSDYGCCPYNETEANFTEMGWWSLTRSNGSGVINVTSQIEYSKRKVSGHFLAGDFQRDEYAVDYTVEFYNDAALIFTLIVTGNTESKHTETFTQISNINKAILNITKWSAINTCVKIAESTTQVVEIYYDDVVCDWLVLEEREISNDNTLPAGNISSNQASMCIINNENRKFDANNTLSRLYQLVKPNSFVAIYMSAGNLGEWVPVYKGWVANWDVPESEKTATATIRDRLELMTQTDITTSVVQVDLTIFEWFELVLNDYGLANTQYDIDTTLNGSDYIIPYGWFVATSHRRALTILAEASSSVVYQDREGLIQIKTLNDFPGGVVKTFTQNDYSDKDNQPIYQNIANKITVKTSPLLKTIGVTVYQTIATDPETVTASSVETFTIIYNKSPVSDITTLDVFPLVAGVTVTNTTEYSWGADVEVTNINGIDTSFQLRAIGATYEVSGQKQITRSDSASIEDNGLVVFPYPENPFLQTIPLAENIADNMLSSFKDPQRDLTLSFDVGGNPILELGDIIAVTDRYTTKNYKLTRQDLVFNQKSLGMTMQGRV